MWADLYRRPSHVAVLLLCAAAVAYGQWLRGDWYIDDAAICFAYARNIVAGEGIVPWPGAERIEAYSDPTWMALLVLFQFVGLSGFIVAKPLGLLFSLLTLPVVYRTATLVMTDPDDPDRDRSPDQGYAPLFAPVLFALNAQVAIWSSSALENALWGFLLSLAVLFTSQDGRQGGFLRSSVCWLLLAWTRPEGLLYALCGVFWWLVMQVRAGRDFRRPLIGWMIVFWGPTLLLELARLYYFAWPLPNTFYAKLQARDNFPLSWRDRGWFQVRDYAERLWHGWYMPAYVVGLLGLPWRRSKAGYAIALLAGLTLLYPSPDKLAALSFWPDSAVATPEELAPGEPLAPWIVARIVILALTVVVLPLLTVGEPLAARTRWDIRALCWHCCGISLLFSVYANGDWMGGYRFMSLMAPCQAVLLAVGLQELATVLERQISGAREGLVEWRSAGWLFSALTVAGMIVPNGAQLRDHILYNKNETPKMVRLRADYTASVVKRTFYEGVVRNLEMDQGAHLWWRPEYVEIDMAGLVDVAMARHNYSQRVFIEDYVFDENPPTFGHVHLGWAKLSGFKTYPRWSEMVELPPYKDEPGLRPHDGVWARRTLFALPRWEGPDRKVLFGDGLTLHGFDTPGEIWGKEDKGFLELGASAREGSGGEGIRLVAFLADDSGVVATFDLPLGYGLFPMEQWREDEVFIGRYAPMLEPEVHTGWYDLGFVAFGADGRVLPASLPEGSPAASGGAVIGGDGGVPARLAAGEVRFPRAIKVVSHDDMVARAEAVKDQVFVDAEGGHCESAEAGWIKAKRVRPGARKWAASELPAISRAIADCWALRAERDDAAAEMLLANAHRWDHHSPELARVGEPVGERLWREGKEARSRKDWQTAYDRFDALLKFQPWRSWARRYAEEARDYRLGLATP